MIHIGFSDVSMCDPKATTLIRIKKNGRITFHGRAAIGHGSKIFVSGSLSLGDGFGISSNGKIYCSNNISFGNDCTMAWDVLVMDSDSHLIINEDGATAMPTKPIIIGEHVWLCYGTSVLKGSVIPDNCVVGCKSLVGGSNFEPNSIIVGHPAKSTKRISTWKL